MPFKNQQSHFGILLFVYWNNYNILLHKNKLVYCSSLFTGNISEYDVMPVSLIIICHYPNMNKEYVNWKCKRPTTY